MTTTQAATPPATPAKPSKPKRDPRIIALRNFAISITVLNVLGYTVLGFEQGWLWPVVAVATGYTMELTLEVISAWAERRLTRFSGKGVRGFVEFLYPAHITALAVNLLVYVNDQIFVMMLAVMIGVGGKWLLRVPVKGRMRHFMNPSNLGITAVLLLFPWVNVAPPYHFTEYISGFWDWLVPILIIAAGTMLNGKLTKRMWLIGAWLIGFALQAIIRGLVTDVSTVAALGVMTGVAFVLFTNYMITDPGTSPFKPASQIAFGGGAAVLYGLVTALGLVYGLFLATIGVCLIRGGFLWALHFVDKARQPAAAATVPVQIVLDPMRNSKPVAVEVARR